MECLHPQPQCVISFESVQDLQFYLQDVYCIEFTRGIKRYRSGAKAEINTDRIKRLRRTNKHDKDEFSLTTEYKFVDETAEIIKSKATNPVVSEGTVV